MLSVVAKKCVQFALIASATAVLAKHDNAPLEKAKDSALMLDLSHARFPKQSNPAPPYSIVGAEPRQQLSSGNALNLTESKDSDFGITHTTAVILSMLGGWVMLQQRAVSRGTLLVWGMNWLLMGIASFGRGATSFSLVQASLIPLGAMSLYFFRQRDVHEVMKPTERHCCVAASSILAICAASYFLSSGHAYQQSVNGMGLLLASVVSWIGAYPTLLKKSDVNTPLDRRQRSLEAKAATIGFACFLTYRVMMAPHTADLYQTLHNISQIALQVVLISKMGSILHQMTSSEPLKS